MQGDGRTTKRAGRLNVFLQLGADGDWEVVVCKEAWNRELGWHPLRNVLTADGYEASQLRRLLAAAEVQLRCVHREPGVEATECRIIPFPAVRRSF